MKPWGKGFSTFIVIAILVFVYFVFLQFYDALFGKNLLWDTLPDFLGGALGIILALGITEWIGEMKDNKKVKEIKQMLRAELENCLKLAKQQSGNLLPTVSWRLLLSTGDLRLLPFDQFREISTIYTIIENQNYESTQLRNTNIAIISGLTSDEVTNSQKIQYQIDLGNRNKQREQETSDSIQNMLNQDWWTSSEKVSIETQNQLKDMKN